MMFGSRFLVLMLVLPLLAGEPHCDVLTLDQVGSALKMPVQGKMGPNPFSVTGINGHVIVMNYSGDVADFEVSAAHPVDFHPRQEMMRAFYEQVGDVYDIVAFTTDFSYILNGAQGFYVQIQNDTEGIGIPVLDHSAGFHSTGKLQGLIELGNSAKYLREGVLARDQFQALMLHEIGHRWLAHASYMVNGQISRNLQMVTGGHWSFLLDSDASHMYGHDWEPVGDGTWTIAGVRSQYSDLDLYLMGFLPQESVAPLTLLHSSEIPDQSSRFPTQQATITATPETIDISQIIAAEGPRDPAFTNKARTLRMAFIYLQTGTPSAPADLAEFDSGLAGLNSRFQRQTRGLGHLDFRPSPYVSNSVGLDETNALNFLEMNRVNDAWADTDATAVRDSVEVIRALVLHERPHDAAVNALSARVDRNLDDVARIAALKGELNRPDSARMAVLRAAQHEDGGFALRLGRQSNVLDTALALNAFIRQSEITYAAEIQAAVNYLLLTAGEDGSWGLGEGTAFETAMALEALQRQTVVSGATLDLARARATTWLLGYQGAHGGIGQTDVDFVVTSHLQRALGLTGTFNVLARQFMERGQAANGSWNNSVHTTALVLSTLKQLEDLQVADVGIHRDRISFSPQAPVLQQPFNVTADITNHGNGPAEDVTLTLYLNDPDEGGVPQISTALVNPLLPGESRQAQLTWDVPGGLTQYSVVLVVSTSSGDASPANDRIRYDFNVSIPGPDPLIDSDVLLSTGEPLVGEVLQIRVPILNAGGETATRLLLSLFDGDPNQDGQLIDGPIAIQDLVPFQRVAHQFNWTAPGPIGLRTLFLVLESDEDLRPENNQWSRQIQIRDLIAGVDLAINPLTLALNPETYLTAPQPFTTTFEVATLGQTTPPGFTASWYRGPPESGGILLDSNVFPTNGSVPVAVSLSSTLDFLGDYDLVLMVEPQGGNLDERDANNRHVLRLAGLSLEDFEVVPGSLNASPLIAGGEVVFQAQIQNRNLLPRTGVSVSFEVDSGNGYELVGRDTVGIPGAGSSVASITWSAPETPINGMVRVVVDPDLAINEVDEDDNEATLAFSTQPDTLANLTLTLDAISFSPPPYHEGERLDVMVLVTNTGGAAAAGTMTLYLNNEGSGPLVPAQAFPELAPGEQTTVTFTIDPLAFRGDQLIMAQVETDTQESNPDDNTGFRSIYVVGGPNPTFGPTPISLNPTWPAEGESVTVTISLENQGALEATDLVVDLRSSDDMADLIERRSLNLPPGQQDISFQITAQAGLNQLVCLLDPENQIIEQVETDNRAVLGLVLRDGEMALDESIFSPNGDGIKDQVTLFWERPEASLTLNITNTVGDLVRQWTDLAGSGSLIWNGRDGNDKLLGDGFYTFQLVDPMSGFPLRDQTVAIDNNRGTIADSLATSDPGFYSISDPEKDLGFEWFGWAEDASSLLADTGSSGPALYVAPDGSHTQTLGDPFEWAIGGRSIAGYPGQWLVQTYDGIFYHFNNGEMVRNVTLGFDDALQAWIRPGTALVWNFSTLNLVNLVNGAQTPLQIPGRNWGSFIAAFVYQDIIYVLERDTSNPTQISRILTWDWEGQNFSVYREYVDTDLEMVQQQGRYFALGVEPTTGENDIIFFDLDQGREVRWSELYPGSEPDGDKIFDDARLHLAPIETGTPAFGVVGDWVTNRRFVVTEASLKLLAEKISPDGTRIAARALSDFDQDIYTSRHNLGLSFEAFLTGAGAVQVQGTAADRHLQDWRLDYAMLTQPDQWFPTGINGNFQILDSFMGIWVPEHAGSYLLRLTARDKAGNEKSRKTVIEVIETLPFYNLLREPFFFSPNNDGVQDEVTLSFTVRDPFQGNLIITDDNGVPVRNITSFYGSAGPASLSWDGRGDGGSLVPDGLYRLNFNGLSYSVILDKTAPQVALEFVESLRRHVQVGDETVRTVATCFEMLVHDPHIQAWRLERRPIGEQDWILVRSDSGNYQTSPYDDFPDYLPTTRQLLGHEFRIVAEDIAGNTTTLTRVPNIPAQVWTMAGPSLSPFREEPNEPLTTLPYGGIELLSFEAVLPRDRFPLTLTSLEYGPDRRLTNPTIVNSPQAEQTVFNGPFFEPGLFDRNLPAEDNIYFRLVLTDALGTVYRTEVVNRLNVRFQVELISLLQRDSGEYRVEYRITSDANTESITGTLLGLQEPAGRFPRPVPFGFDWEPGEECRPTIATETWTTWPNATPPTTGNELGNWNKFILDDVILFAGSPNHVRLGRFVSQQFCSFSVNLEAVPHCRENGEGRVFDVHFPIQVLGGGSLQFFADAAGKQPLSEMMPLQNGLGTIRLDDTMFSGPDWFPIYASLKDSDGRNVIFSHAVSGDRISFLLEDLGETGSLIQPGGALYVTNEPIQPLIEDQVICAPSQLEIAAWNSDRIPIPRTIEFEAGRLPSYRPFERTRYRLPASPLYQLWVQPVGMDEPVIPLSIANINQAEIDLGPLLGFDAWEIHLQAINESGHCDSSVANLIFSDQGGGLYGDFSILEDDSATRTLFSPNHPVHNSANVRIQVSLTAGFAAWIETTGEPAEVVSVLRGGGSLPVGKHDISWDGLNEDGNRVADGVYRLVIAAYAACGSTHEQSIRVTLDSQPPIAQIDKPSAGTVRLPAPVQVTATDENYLSRVTLTVFPTADPAQVITHYDDHQPRNLQGVVLPPLNLVPGEFTLRWLVIDSAGNQTEVTSTILVERHLTLEVFELTETWISPNGDGVQDGTVIRYGLGAAAPVTLEVRQAAPGGDQWVLLDHAMTAPGVHERFFNGDFGNGVVLADGAYEWVITVHGANGDEISITDFFIDTIQPHIIPTFPLPDSVHDAQVMPVRVDITDGTGNIANWRLQHESDSVVRHTIATGFGEIVGTTLAEISNPEAGTNTLYVSAQDEAGNSSSHSFAFIRDPFAPTVALENPIDDAIVSSGTLNIHGTFSEDYPESLVLSLVNEAGDATQLAELLPSDLNPSSFHFVAPLNEFTDGHYTLQATMTDQPGHIGEDLVPIVLDRLPPLVALDPFPNGGLLTGPTPINGTVSDPSLERWELAIAPASGGGFIPIISDTQEPEQQLLYLWSILPADGEWRLRLSATDRGGRTSEVVENLVIDTTPPNAPASLFVVPNQYGDAPARFSRVTLTWPGVMDPGLAGYVVYRNGIQITNAPISTTTYLDDPVDDGDWLYQVRAVDLAGNASDFVDAPLVTLDTVAPQPLITQPRQGDVVGGLVAITGSITDPRLADWTLEFRDDAAPGIWTLLTTSTEAVTFGELYQWIVSGLLPGGYQIRLRARDTFGNVGETTVAVVVETEAPAKPATPSVSEIAQGLRVTWTANAEPDIDHYRVYRNDAFVGTDSPVSPLEFTEELPDGVYAYRVIAVDSAGNRSPISDASPPYTLDLRDPHVIWISPVGGARFETTLQLEAFSADTDILSVLFQYQPVASSTWIDIANDGEAPWSVLWDPLGQPQGEYRLRAVAMERDTGDIDPNPEILTVGFGDATAPGIPVIESHMLTGSQVSLTWRAQAESDLAGYRVYRNQVLVGNTDAATTTLVDPNGTLGTQTYTVTSLDLAGNESDPSEELQVEIVKPLLDEALVWAVNDVAAFSGSGHPEYVSVEARQGMAVVGTTALDVLGRFQLDVTPSLNGFNDIDIVQVHPDGHTSLPAPATALLAGLPQTVTQLQGAADGGSPENIDLTWVEPIPAEAGYLIRADGVIRQGMGTAGIDSAVGSSSTHTDHRMIDGNPSTFWLSWFSDHTRRVVLNLNQPTAVKGLQIQWYNFFGIPSSVQVEARVEGRMVPLWSFPTDGADDMDTVALGLTDRLLVTDQLTLMFTHSERVGIREIQVLTQELLPPGTNSYQDMDPGPGLHNYEVLSMSSFGQTASAGPVVIGIGDVTAPQAPTGLSATVNGSDVTLTWTASVSNDVVSYRIYRDGRILATLPDLSHLDPGLHRKLYRYHVTAIDGSGNESEPSNLVDANVEAGFEPPVLSGFVDGFTVKIQWQYGANPQLQTFRVFRRKGIAAPFELISDPAAEPWTQTRWQDGGPLSAATEYTYRVAAVDQENRETFSNTVTFLMPVPEPTVTFPGSVGASVTLFEPQTTLAGFAEPGTRVRIYKDNQLWKEVETSTQLKSATDHLSFREPLGLALSPDGRWLVHTNRTFHQLTLKQLETGDTSNIWVSDRASSPIFNPSSSILAYVDRAEAAETGMLEIMDLTTQAQHSPYPAGSVREPLAWQSHGHLVFSTGNEIYAYDPRKKESQLLWNSTDLLTLITVDRGSDRLIVRETSSTGITRISSIAGPGDRILWLETNLDYQYAWSPAARQLTAVDANGAVSYLLIDASQAPVAAGLSPKGSLSDFVSLVGVSPDGRMLLSQQTSGVLASWSIAANQPMDLGILGQNEQTWAPAWTSTGEIITAYRVGTQFPVTRYQLPGFFRTVASGLEVGPNYVTFDALELTTQTASARTENLILNYSLEMLPDLQVSEDSLRLFPAVVVPGDMPVVQVNIRNLGGGDADHVVLRWELTAPDGSMSEPVTDQMVTVPAGSLTTAGFELDSAAFVDGTYILSLSVDPDEAIEESNEENNSATRSFLFSTSNGAILDVALATEMIPALGDLIFDAEITNLGMSLNDVRVTPRVENLAGSVLAELESWVVDPFPVSSQAQNTWDWSTAGLLAGDYRLVVSLTADGTPLAERSLDFTIDGQPSADLTLSQAPASINTPAAIAPQALLINTSGNVAFTQLTWRAELRDEADQLIAFLDHNLPILLPGADHRFHFNFETVGLLPGNYRVALQVFENSAPLAQAQTALVVISDPIYSAGVSLYVSPFNLQAGDSDVDAEAVISNTGNRDLTLEAVLAWLDENDTLLASHPQTFDLAPGETGSFETRFPTADLPAGAYQVRLHNDDQVGAEMTLSERVAVNITNNRAPEIAILGLPRSGHASAAVTLQIQVLDDEDPLPEAVVLLNGQPYISGTPITGEGYYTVEARVTDASGSQASAEAAFDIDLSPPEISVLNLNDGDVLDGSIIPQIQVQDLNIVETKVTLNNEPYLSGQPVVLPGAYLLHIEAEDILGHRAQLDVNFTIVKRQPYIEFTGINDGGQYSEPRTVGVNLRNGSQLESFQVNGVNQTVPYQLTTEGASSMTARASLNGSTQDIVAVVVLDFTAPLILVQGVTHLAHYNTSVGPFVLVDGQPATSGVLLDGNPFVSGTEVASEGNHQLHVQAIDPAGNMAVAEVQFTLDFTAPELAIFGVEDGGLYTDTRMISWVASDDWLEGVSAYLNGVTVSSPLNISDPGDYVLRISARDQAGNSVSREIAFRLATGYVLALNADPVEGGTVTGAGTWPEGTQAAIRAVPAEGFRFDGWLGEGVTDPQLPETIVAMTSNRNITASFVRTWDLSVLADPPEGGTVDGSGLFDEGTAAPISAVPAVGYRFKGWAGEGVTDPQALNATVMMTETRLVTAQFGFNTAPVVANPIHDQTVLAETFYQFVIPEDTFRDADPGDALSYEMTLADDNPLPLWLTFDPISRELNGTPEVVDIGVLILKVTVRDEFGEQASDEFQLTVEAANLGEIHGLVYEDANANGRLDAGEMGLANRTLFLDLNRNGMLDGDEPSQYTDAQGAYAFTNLAAGTYVLRTVAPEGWRTTLDMDTLFISPQQFPAGIAPGDMQSSLMNGDDFPELVLVGENEIRIHTSGADGHLVPIQSLAGGQSFASVAVLDVNGDGYDDLASVEPGADVVTLLMNRGDGTFEMPVSMPVGSMPHLVIAMDVDHDQDPDLVVANSGALSLSLLINQDGEFEPAQTRDMGVMANHLVALELTNDLFPDLIMVGSQGQLWTMRNFGGAAFGKPTSVLNLAGPLKPVLGDWNDDGRIDVALTDRKQLGVFLMINHGSQGPNEDLLLSLGSYLPGFVTADPHGDVLEGLVSGDLDLDGDTDLLMTYGPNDELALLENLGGSFAPAKRYATPANPGYLSLLDLSDDGDMDPVFFTGTKDIEIVGFANNRIRTVVVEPGQVQEHWDFGSSPLAPVRVIAPNGGEKASQCDALVIHWSTYNLNGAVDIQLSRDGGRKWETLFSAIENDGNETWQVSGDLTDDALIRVRNSDSPDDADTSDLRFAIVENEGDPKANHAVHASSLTIHSNARIDSFDARLGPYGEQNLGQEGHLRSLGTIEIRPNAQILGHVRPGSAGQLKVEPAPVGLVSLGNLTLKSRETLVLEAGDYRYDTLELKNQSVLKTNGPVRIWFSSLTLHGSAKVEPMDLQSTNLRLYGLPTAGTVELKAHSELHGFIYSPAGDVIVRSNASVFGAITGNQVTVHAHAQIHRDLALGQGSGCGEIAYTGRALQINHAVTAVSGQITVGENVIADRYDSCLGSYSEGNSGGLAQFQAAGDIIFANESWTTEHHNPNTPSDALPVTIPEGLNSAGDLVIPARTTVRLAAGNYWVNNLTLNSESRLLGTDGPVRIWYTGTLRVNSKAHLEGHDGFAVNMMLFGQDGGHAEIQAHGQITGLLYSPGQQITINTHGQVSGAIVAAMVEIKAGGKIHFDQALAEACATKKSSPPPARRHGTKPNRPGRGRQ